MKQLTKEQQQYIVAAVLGVFCLGYVYINYMIKPANKKVTELSQKLEEKKSQVEKMKRQANRLPALKREYESLVAEVGETEKRIPKAEKIDDILRVITEETMRLRIDLQSFTPATPIAKGFYREIPIRIDLSAGFHTLGHLLSELGQKERIICASNLSMNSASSKNADSANTIKADFILLTYVFIN